MCNQMVTVEIKEFSLEFCPNYDYFPPPNAREIMTIWTMDKSSYSLISTVFDKTTLYHGRYITLKITAFDTIGSS